MQLNISTSILSLSKHDFVNHVSKCSIPKIISSGLPYHEAKKNFLNICLNEWNNYHENIRKKVIEHQAKQKIIEDEIIKSRELDQNKVVDKDEEIEKLLSSLLEDEEDDDYEDSGDISEKRYSENQFFYSNQTNKKEGSFSKGIKKTLNKEKHNIIQKHFNQTEFLRFSLDYVEEFLFIDSTYSYLSFFDNLKIKLSANLIQPLFTNELYNSPYHCHVMDTLPFYDPKNKTFLVPNLTIYQVNFFYSNYFNFVEKNLSHIFLEPVIDQHINITLKNIILPLFIGALYFENLKNEYIALNREEIPHFILDTVSNHFNFAVCSLFKIFDDYSKSFSLNNHPNLNHNLLKTTIQKLLSLQESLSRFSQKESFALLFLLKNFERIQTKSGNDEKKPLYTPTFVKKIPSSDTVINNQFDFFKV